MLNSNVWREVILLVIKLISGCAFGIGRSGLLHIPASAMHLYFLKYVFQKAHLLVSVTIFLHSQCKCIFLDLTGDMALPSGKPNERK